MQENINTKTEPLKIPEKPIKKIEETNAANLRIERFKEILEKKALKKTNDIKQSAKTAILGQEKPIHGGELMIFLPLAIIVDLLDILLDVAWLGWVIELPFTIILWFWLTTSKGVLPTKATRRAGITFLIELIPWLSNFIPGYTIFMIYLYIKHKIPAIEKISKTVAMPKNR